MSNQTLLVCRWAGLGADSMNYAVFLLKVFSLNYSRGTSQRTTEFRPANKTAGLFFFTVNITTNKMTERRRDILGFKGLQRLCPSISLVLWNQKHLLTFLCLSLILVTSASLWRKGQLSVSMVYILPSHNGHLYIFKFYPKDEMFYF